MCRRAMMEKGYSPVFTDNAARHDEHAGSIGEFGRMRFIYLREKRPEMIKELLSEKKLKPYLKKVDARAWDMMKEIERSMKQSSEILRNKREYDVIEIMVERRQIKNTAYNFVRREYICR